MEDRTPGDSRGAPNYRYRAILSPKYPCLYTNGVFVRFIHLCVPLSAYTPLVLFSLCLMDNWSYTGGILFPSSAFNKYYS